MPDDVAVRLLLIADTHSVVTDLNARARADLIIDGAVEPGGVRLSDGNHASVGDTVTSQPRASSPSTRTPVGQSAAISDCPAGRAFSATRRSSLR